MADTPLATPQAIDRVLIATLSRLARATGDTGHAEITLALAQVGKAMQVDRAFLFWANAEGRFAITHDWAEPGIVPSGQVSAGEAFAMPAAWRAVLQTDTPLIIDDIDGLPADLGFERDWLHRADVNAVIMVPVREGDAIIGVVGFDMVRRQRSFGPEAGPGLQALASGIGGLMLRMRAEMRLRESRDRLQATLDALPDLIIETDRDGIVRSVHLSADRSELTDPVTLVGQSLFGALPPHAAALARDMLAELRYPTPPQPRRYALDVRGVQRWFEARATKWTAGDGGYAFIIRDITTEHDAAQREQARLRQLQQIFDHAPIGMALSDMATGVLLDANQAFLSQSGYTRDAFRKMRIADITLPEQRDLVIAQLDVLSKTGRYGPVQQRYRRADGSLADVVLTGVLAHRDGAAPAIWHFVDDQTERLARKAEIDRRRQEAEAAQATLLAAVEALTDGFAIYDADNRLVLCNSHYRSHFPRSGHLMQPGMHYDDITRLRLEHDEYRLTPEQKQKWLADRKAQLDRTESSTIQQLADGRWIRTFERRTKDGGRVGLRADITELRLAQERLEQVIAGARIGTWEWDVKARSTKVNDIWRETLGLPPSTTVLGPQDFLPLLHPDDAQRMADQLGQITKGQQSRLETTVRLRHADGHWVWAMFRGNTIQRDAAGLPSLMSGIVLDVSNDVQREQAITAARDALQNALAARDQAEQDAKAARDRLQAAVEAMRDGFVLFDADDRVVLANSRFRELYPGTAPVIQPGITFEQILRQSVAVGDVADAVGRPEDWIAERMAQHLRASETVEQRLSDGRVLRVYEVPTSDGGRVGIRIDVTELYDARERAEAASRAKSAFLANMSHEIRTPMNGILGMAELLAATNLSREQAQMLGTIRASGDALLSIINDILDLARIEAGKMQIDPRPFDMVQLAHRLQSLLGVQAHAKGLTMTLVCKGEDQQTRLGDETRIGQVLGNLIGNAIKFTEQGQVHIDVDCTDPGMVRLGVRDTGIGMSADQVRRVFEEFEQADTSITRRFGGSGLGLSIVRRLIDLMGGQITVDSTPGAGTQVAVTLPLPLAQAAPAAPALPAPRPLPKGLRLLVAEDNRTNTAILRAILNAAGVDAVYTENGRDAVAAWESGRFDLLLLDISMPVMDGVEALDQITARARAISAPVPRAIAATANVMEDQVATYLGRGFAAVLGKPYKSADLFRVMGELLADRA